MESARKIILAAALGSGVLALSIAQASAAIVCNGDTCWHTHASYDYPPEAGVVVHSDDWRWGPQERFAWREHEGRGYWHGDTWRDW